MRTADKWKDYELLDCSDGERLERWGEIILVRPDPQVVWKTEKKHPLWRKADAVYRRSSSGGGRWELHSRLPESWQIGYHSLTFNVRATGFKHTGLFPEQAVNWDMTSRLIKEAGREVSVLNLFGYSGAATVSALKAGARVTHVDAAKGMVSWARENAAASGVAQCPVRWLVDDCIKFAEREIRRGNTYDIIIMDPPSYGRGPGGEVWKFEDEIFAFVGLCSQLLSENALMLLVNSYTTGLSPAVMEYIFSTVVVPTHAGSVESDDIGLPVSSTGLSLPCGTSTVWRGN